MKKGEFGYESFVLMKQGDRGAEVQFYTYFRRHIRIILMSFPMDTQLRDDIVQETLTKALQSREIFKDTDHLAKWLKRVAINATISYRRSNTSENNKREGYGYLSELIDYAASLEAEHTHLHQRLFKCISDLPLISRRVIILTFWHGRSVHEIARQLNISVNAVVARKCRALKFLRDQMGDPGFG
ncbi:MAG TPA: sigma-70 family RNA polymerase sigma factor [Puia sp.]|jgi:RNA polymerase sigma-70 factor (ECF subfamily)